MIQERNIYSDFFNLTRRDIQSFFQDCLGFFQSDYITISDYFSGRSKTIDSISFDKFSRLQLERNSYFETISQYSTQMSGTKWYEIVELLEVIDSRFQTLSNINKWARASVTRTAYSPTVQIDYNIAQNQTLETIARDVLFSQTPQDSWVDIALDNNLAEEDYSSEGGNNLQLQIGRNINLGIQVESVVDILQGKSIYGKDLNRNLTITNEDYEVLGYDKTILQSVDILVKLKRNDNPDYPNLGLQSNIAIGQNRSVLNFPIITRQMTQTFSSDDTLKNFNIESIKLEQDNLMIKYNVMTRLNEVVPSKEITL